MRHDLRGAALAAPFFALIHGAGPASIAEGVFIPALPDTWTTSVADVGPNCWDPKFQPPPIESTVLGGSGYCDTSALYHGPTAGTGVIVIGSWVRGVTSTVTTIGSSLKTLATATCDPEEPAL